MVSPCLLLLRSIEYTCLPPRYLPGHSFTFRRRLQWVSIGSGPFRRFATRGRGILEQYSRVSVQKWGISMRVQATSMPFFNLTAHLHPLLRYHSR